MAKDSPLPGPEGPPVSLVSALRRLLAPLVRALIRHGVTFPYLANLLKELYVAEAEAHFPVPGKRQTDSRITLLTGVHRKDVKRLRGRGGEPRAVPPAVSRSARMIALWAGAPDFTDDEGRPRPLPRLAPGGGGPSFEALAEAVSKDIRPRAVLDEWLRLGLVRLDDEDRVHLDESAFVPRRGFDDLAYYFGRNLADHVAASAHNLSGEGEPFLERAVYYDRLTPESVEALSRLSKEAGMRALTEINREALKRADEDEGDPKAGKRMTFGVYFFGADDEPTDDGEPGDER